MRHINRYPAPIVLTDAMIHDLNNHLTAALGHSELLAMELPADDTTASSIIEIREACRKAVDLIARWAERPGTGHLTGRASPTPGPPLR